MTNRRFFFRLAAAPVAACAAASWEAALRARNELLNADQWNWHVQQAFGGAEQPAPEEYLPESFERFGLMTADQYIAMRRAA